MHGTAARDALLSDLKQFARTEFRSETPSLLSRLTEFRRKILGCWRCSALLGMPCWGSMQRLRAA